MKKFINLCNHCDYPTCSGCVLEKEQEVLICDLCENQIENDLYVKHCGKDICFECIRKLSDERERWLEE